MTCCFGLYFGSTNMCLSMQKDGKTEVLANAAGDRVTPSVVAFQNGERAVGLAAKHGMYRNASNTILNVKELIDGDESNCEKEILKSTCKIIEKNGLKYEIEKEGKLLHYSPHEILVTLFSTMKEIACSHSHYEDIYPTVVTVPLWFSKGQREIIKKAVTEAGFELLRLISEPSAALLAYNIGQESSSATLNCLVFRMGGTSLDLTVLRVINGMYNVLSTVRKNDIGGHLLTSLLVDFCSSEFQRQYKVDIRESKRSVMKLHAASENCKHVLSTLGSAQCFAESVYDGIDLSINVSRARFESRVVNTLQQCMEPIHNALSIADLSVSDISKVVLAGGSCKIPKLQQLISELFTSADVLYNIGPDEVIAVGAAIEATHVTRNGFPDQDEYFIDVLSQDLYTKIFIDGEAPVITLLSAKGSLVPIVQHQDFNVLENASSMKLEIFEGDFCCRESDTNRPLAALSMSNLPVEQISFSFHIRSDGSIFVICKDSACKELGSTVIHASRAQGCT